MSLSNLKGTIYNSYNTFLREIADIHVITKVLAQMMTQYGIINVHYNVRSIRGGNSVFNLFITPAYFKILLIMGKI